MNQKLSDLDPGDKPTDVGDERRRRHAALLALREAIATEVRVEAEAAEATGHAAETAMWLGASLADLAAVTGRSRQAARKRWPTLGAVHRRRAWLGNHVDDIRWAVRVVLENSAEIDVQDRAVFDELRALDESVGIEFGPAAEGGSEPAARWHDLDRLVDVVLRRVTAEGAARGGQAEFALHGAGGVVGYYDHAGAGTGTPDDD
ncbi:hypothetical protein [Rhodococcoides yunnanense]|uniref:hypothetical protein n=1 Tax=Rhodococcoides yunnanense TaxID=278209 RepID=UPI000935018C|nr:hypothetical protein [Rhodococcus yunnanensis]